MSIGPSALSLGAAQLIAVRTREASSAAPNVVTHVPGLHIGKLACTYSGNFQELLLPYMLCML